MNNLKWLIALAIFYLYVIEIKPPDVRVSHIALFSYLLATLFIWLLRGIGWCYRQARNIWRGDTTLGHQ